MVDNYHDASIVSAMRHQEVITTETGFGQRFVLNTVGATLIV